MMSLSGLMQRSVTPPVVVLGMHRSGTSMVSRFLESLGVYMGRDQTGNAESRFFQSLNRSIIKEAGGDWVDIKPALERLQVNGFVEEQAKRLRNVLFCEKGLRSFQGELRFLTFLLGLKQMWGWKDPRSTVTLPVWLEVFPRLRVIYIVRSGIDVAISLHRRETRRSTGDRDFRLECLDFDACFDLWNQYAGVWKQNRDFLEQDRRLELKFESVLQTPEFGLREITGFLGLGTSHAKLMKIAGTVDRTRLRNAVLRREYAEMIDRLPPSGQMKELGYVD